MEHLDFGKLGVKISVMTIAELQICKKLFDMELGTPFIDDRFQKLGQNLLFIMCLNTPEHFKRSHIEFMLDPVILARNLSAQIGGEKSFSTGYIKGIYPENAKPSDIKDMLKNLYPDAYKIFQELSNDPALSASTSILEPSSIEDCTAQKLQQAWEIYVTKIKTDNIKQQSELEKEKLAINKYTDIYNNLAETTIICTHNFKNSNLEYDITPANEKLLTDLTMNNLLGGAERLKIIQQIRNLQPRLR